MKQRLARYIILVLFCCSIFFAIGAFLYEKAVTDKTSENKNETYTEIIGELEHGLASFSVDGNTGNAFITYEGGELEIEYRAKATGMSEYGVGFMIFIDGIAQPYWISEETEAMYMHTFYFQDKVDNVFSFYLIPTTGQKGDMLELCIASIYYPDYKPDMKESKGYGIYHDMLENSYIIKYNASPSLITNDMALNLISEVEIEELPIQQDKYITTNLSNDFNVALYINDQDVTNGNYYIADEKENNIKLGICGTESAEYRISFFSNHCPVSSGWENELQIHVTPDKITEIDVEIDISSLDGYDTFYALIVPCDAPQIATRKSGLIKTNSVLIVPSSSQIEEEEQKIILNDAAGIINCVEDGNLLFAGKRIMLMNGHTLEIQKDAENTAPLLINPHTDLHGNSYLLTGLSSTEGHFTIQYDSDLRVKQIIDIEEIANPEREIMVCKWTGGGDKLLYNNINGLYLFDFVTGETKDLTQKEIFIYSFAVLEENQKIVFNGLNADEGRILGLVDMDGEGQQEISTEHLWGDMWAFEDFLLIEEADVVGKEKEGMVFRYDMEEELHSFPLSSDTENGNITVSCNGCYYSTRTSMQDDETRYVIRVYSSQDGSLVRELALTYKEYGENFLLNGYLICDDLNRIILYGTWRGQETDTWIVSKRL